MTVHEETVMKECYQKVLADREEIANRVESDDKALETARRVMEIFGYPWKKQECVSQLKMLDDSGFLSFQIWDGDSFIEPMYPSRLMMALSRAKAFLAREEQQRMLEFLSLYCNVEGDVISFGK